MSSSIIGQMDKKNVWHIRMPKVGLVTNCLAFRLSSGFVVLLWPTQELFFNVRVWPCIYLFFGSGIKCCFTHLQKEWEKKGNTLA
jgi:hypothetical protein